MERILVIGGAGYVGSVTVEELINRGYDVIVLDNLYEGHREAVHSKAAFTEGSMANDSLLERMFSKYHFDGVMHFAGETVIEYSMTDPFRYFNANIIDGLKVLNCMVKFDIKKFIFSSTSAVYGEAQEIPITENHPTVPENSYGESKFIFERMLRWYYLSHGIQSISFRYFNAAGASERYGEAHKSESHLIPLVLQVALGKREKVSIFGDDYPTKDGTCVRDFTHVCDIAVAHILGYEKVGEFKHDVFNLGNGSGYTVGEAIQCAREITGSSISTDVVSRRPGDATIMVASSEKAKTQLGWRPKYPSLKQIIESAWNWHRRHPDGYKS